MKKRGFVPALVPIILILGNLPAPGTVFVDSTRVNVLREYDRYGSNLVTQTVGGTGLQTTAGAGNDGSGRPDQWQIPGSNTGTSSFVLPGWRTVGSFKMNFNGSHLPTGGLLLEGLTSGGWVTLTNIVTVPSTPSGSFSPQTVRAIRYTVTGPGTGPNYIQANETQVFLTSGQTINYFDGYNILRDAGKVASTTDSATSGPWTIRSSAQGASSTYDGDYFSGHVHAGGTVGGLRAFMTLTLNAPTILNAGHLGWYGGQVWNNWEVYSSDAASMPTTQSLGANTPAAIQAAGWTLQYARAGTDQERFFDFLNGGDVRHLFIVWDGPGAMVEFEAFQLLPEPSTVTMAVLGGTLLWGALRRRRSAS